jgi:formylglycine-generating enzyme required for sulfatase activity
MESPSMIEADLREKLKVFISYSRRDMAFADRIANALKSRGFVVLIDRQDLPKLEDWERELLDLVRQADTVVFIVSRHSLASRVVGWEIEQVRLHGKRLAPIVIENVEGIPVPADVAKINYLFFLDDDSFERNADELAHALNKNLTWIKEHTRLGELARRWLERGKTSDALLRGVELDDALAWAASRPLEAPQLMELQLELLAASRRGETLARQRSRRVQGMIIILLLGVIGIGSLAYGGWLDSDYLEGRVNLVKNTMRESDLRPGDTVRECAGVCPEMVLVPAGEFTMGSNERDPEKPPHKVHFSGALLVAKFETTFDQWDACIARRGCTYSPSDEHWGRGTRPVINVSWDDVRQYLAWLSKITGKSYRLLSESEWEYAARAGSTTAYSWGDDIHWGGKVMANCANCGSKWDFNQTAPVGSFAANAFGIYDMHGNVSEWTEDVGHDNYKDAPTDGSAWLQDGLADTRMLRGGSWFIPSAGLRSSNRIWVNTTDRGHGIGFRVARSIAAEPAHKAMKSVAAAGMPLKLGDTVLLDGFKHYKQSGFSFRTEQVVAWNSELADILVAKSDNGEGDPHFYLPGVEARVDANVISDEINAGIVEMRSASLVDVKACPKSGYHYEWFKVRVGAVYCVRARTGRSYAKIIVSEIGAERIGFQWVYNPSGSLEF